MDPDAVRSTSPPEDVPPVSAEALEGAALREHDGPDRTGRSYPSTIGGVLYLVVLAVALGGLILAWAGNWRLGTTILGASLWGAALGRVVLPNREAGMLAVRNRYLDALLLLVVGSALMVLAISIPDRV